MSRIFTNNRLQYSNYSAHNILSGFPIHPWRYDRMSLRDFFHGNGTIVLRDKFLSLRIIKELLEKQFRIRVLEESSSHLRCKIVRFARLYAFPMPFPNPTLELTFKNEPQQSIIEYRFTCYDYYLLLIIPILFGISSQSWKATKETLIAFLLLFLFFGGLILLDTKYIVFRIRKTISV